MKICIPLLLCLLMLVESQHVNRINYGAVFRHIGYYDNSGVSWLQVINIPLDPSSIPNHSPHKNEVTDLLHRLTEAVHHRQRAVSPSGPLHGPISAGLHPALQGDPQDRAQDAWTPSAQLTPHQRTHLLNRTLLNQGNVSMATTHTVEGANPRELDLPLGQLKELEEIHRLLKETRERRKEMQLVRGLRELVRLQLTPDLVSYDVMESVLGQVSDRLATEMPDFQLTHPEPAFYFQEAAAEALWDGKNLVVGLSLPLTSEATRFSLFHVATPDVAVRQDSDNITRLMGVAPLLAVRGNGSEAVELSLRDLDQCGGHGGALWRCDISRPVVTSEHPTCLLAVFREDALAVRETCYYEVEKGRLRPEIKELLPGVMLLSKINRPVLQCKMVSVAHAGCTQCTVQVPCQCSLLTTGFETRVLLTGCRKDLSSTEAIVPVNITNLGFLAKTLPLEHPLLKNLVDGRNISADEVPEPRLGTLRHLAAAMGHPRLDSSNAVVAEVSVDVPRSFAAQWEAAVTSNLYLYFVERMTSVGLFLVLLVSFGIAVLVFLYQRRHLEVRLIALEYENIDALYTPEAVAMARAMR